MADTNNKIIRQISTDPSSTYDIAAKYLTDTSGNDYTYESINQTISSVREELLDIAHGVIDTYVIKSGANTKENEVIYDRIVKSNDSVLEVDVDDLDELISPSRPDNIDYHVGDIILMEEVSGDIKIFDRWISAVNGNKVNLAVLETQVALHHHTISTKNDLAIIDITPTHVSYNMAKVGESVSVITGISDVSNDDDGEFVTSIGYDDNDEYNFEISASTTSTSGAVSHSHTVNKHSHKITLTSSAFNTVSAYTVLSNKDYETHVHGSDVQVAGKTSSASFDYVTGVESSVSFIKSLNINNASTTSISLSTQLNDESQTSNLITNESTIGSIKTSEDGSHTHDVTVTTGTNVITSVNLANSVITSVSFNAGNVQNKVVTDVTTSKVNVITSWGNAPTSSFVTSFSCSVNDNGVLSFDAPTSDAVTSATIASTSSNVSVVELITSSNQQAPSLSFSSAKQESGNKSVSLNVSVGVSGSHSHGFNHTHAIPQHTHNINEHNHEYNKTTVVSSNYAYAITSLATSAYTTHTHDSDVSVAAVPSKSTFNATYGGEQTSVLEKVNVSDNVISSTSDGSDTSTVYHTVSGNIVFPGLKVGYKKFDRKSITPAADSEQKPIVSVSVSTSTFITSVEENTSENKGGN